VWEEVINHSPKGKIAWEEILLALFKLDVTPIVTWERLIFTIKDWVDTSMPLDEDSTTTLALYELVESIHNGELVVPALDVGTYNDMMRLFKEGGYEKVGASSDLSRPDILRAVLKKMFPDGTANVPETVLSYLAGATDATQNTDLS
jgi:hypothetical protein